MRRPASSYQHGVTVGGLPMFGAGLPSAPSHSRKPPSPKTKRRPNEIAAAGVALKSGWIDAETALAMLSETGVVELIPTSS
jgi:hypothetical protein